MLTGTIDNVLAQEEEGMLRREPAIGIGRNGILCECVGRRDLRKEGDGEEEQDTVK
jgi:hypothetical protein